jgi:methyl-accepting chemotaxis protein
LLGSAELSDEETRRGRLLALMSLALAPFSALFGVLSLLSEGVFSPGVGLLFVGALVALGNLGVIRRRLGLAGRVLVFAMLLVICPLPWLPGGSGLFDPSQIWTVVTPTVAFFAVSTRWAVGTALINAGNLTALFFNRTDRTLLGTDFEIFHFASLVTVIVVLLLLASAFEASRRAAQRELAVAAEEARRGAEEVRTTNSRLVEARAEAELSAATQQEVADILMRHFRDQGTAIDDTARELGLIVESQRAVAENVRSATDSTTASAQSLTAMESMSDRASGRAQELAVATRQVGSTLDVIVAGGNEVARNVDELSDYANATRKAMDEMRAGLKDVDANARSAEALAERVIASSNFGAEAVARTNDGMKAILASSRTAGEDMRVLDERIDAVGKILSVIQDVADETQLLSLNASIIAAQAGEQGRAFSVVAGEIKKLAERTSTSVGEIADIVAGVQAQSEEARSAIEAGALAIDDGFARSVEAERALEDIVAAAGETTSMVKGITSLTLEQSERSEHVGELAALVAGNAQEIASVTQQHAGQIVEANRAADALRVAAEEIVEVTASHRRASGEVAGEVQRIDKRMEQVQRAQDRQTEGVELILDAVETIRESQREQTRSLASLGGEEE